MLRDEGSALGDCDTPLPLQGQATTASARESWEKLCAVVWEAHVIAFAHMCAYV